MFSNIIIWFKLIFSSDKKSTLLLEEKEKKNIEIQKKSDIIINKKPDYIIILEDSIEKLRKLQNLSKVFNYHILSNIYTQTLYIHNLFSDNKYLNINKLDQFHYYYTDKLFDLLDKIEANHYSKINNLISEKKLIEEKIKNIDNHIDQFLNNIKNSEKYKLSHASKITTQLSAIYNMLLCSFEDFRYKSHTELSSFKKYLSSEAFHIVPSTLYTEISKIEELPHKQNTYSYEEYTIERKLLKQLLNNLFNIDFICSFVSDSKYFELFKIQNTDIYFVYIENEILFKIIDFELIKNYINNKTTSINEYNIERNSYYKKLIDVKTELESENIFDTQTNETLKKYLTKIESVELIETIVDVDIERRILESMIKIEKLER